MALNVLQMMMIVSGGRLHEFTFTTDFAYTDAALDPADAAGTLTFLSTGVITDTFPTGDANKWWESGPVTGIGTGKYVRLATSSGSLNHPSSLSAGVWYELSTSRVFGVERTTLGSQSWQGTVQLSLNGSTVHFESSTVTMTATVS